jgi:hypothetical protein
MPVSYFTSMFCLQFLIVVDTASSEDPTELSFKKGEVLDILTKSDLWWEARKLDGSKGSQFFHFPRTIYTDHSL